MVLIRYVLYFLGVALITLLLTRLEVTAPGSLKLQVFSGPGDLLGTREYSPVELIQSGILLICGLLFAWVARNFPSQRAVAVPFGGLALIFFVRELDYFLDRLIADNFWQAMMAVVAALVIVYSGRQRRRFRIAWLRIWPSPGLTLLFAGAVIMFAFVSLVGHEPLWMAILGEQYQRVAKLAIEEFIELIGYFMWLIGTIEYAYQVRAIAAQEPQTAVAKRRAGRQPKSEGRF